MIGWRLIKASISIFARFVCARNPPAFAELMTQKALLDSACNYDYMQDHTPMPPPVESDGCVEVSLTNERGLGLRAFPHIHYTY